MGSEMCIRDRRETMKNGFVQPFAPLSCASSSDHSIAVERKLSCTNLQGDIAMPKESLEIDEELHPNVKCLVSKEMRNFQMSSLVCNERSTNESSAGDCSSETSSSSFPLQNQVNLFFLYCFLFCQFRCLNML